MKVTTKKQEVQVQVYVTPVMKVALEIAAAKEGRSLSNYLQWYGWMHAQRLGVTIEEAKEVLEGASKSK